MFLDERIYKEIKAISTLRNEEPVTDVISLTILVCLRKLNRSYYSGNGRFITEAKRIDNSWNLAVKKLEKENIRIIKTNQFRQILEDKFKGIKDKIWT